MQISDNARTVLERRYLIKNNQGEVTETVEELFERVAAAIAGQDKQYPGMDAEKTRKQFSRRCSTPQPKR